MINFNNKNIINRLIFINLLYKMDYHGDICPRCYCPDKREIERNFEVIRFECNNCRKQWMKWMKLMSNCNRPPIYGDYDD